MTCAGCRPRGGSRRAASTAPRRAALRTASTDSSRSNGTSASRISGPPSRSVREPGVELGRRRAARPGPCRRSPRAGSSAPRAARSRRPRPAGPRARRRRRTPATGIPSSRNVVFSASRSWETSSARGRRVDGVTARFEHPRRVGGDALPFVGDDLGALDRLEQRLLVVERADDERARATAPAPRRTGRGSGSRARAGSRRARACGRAGRRRARRRAVACTGPSRSYGGRELERGVRVVAVEVRDDAAQDAVAIPLVAQDGVVVARDESGGTFAASNAAIAVVSAALVLSRSEPATVARIRDASPSSWFAVRACAPSSVVAFSSSQSLSVALELPWSCRGRRSRPPPARPRRRSSAPYRAASGWRSGFHVRRTS